jgi:hypothetical protein
MRLPPAIMTVVVASAPLILRSPQAAAIPLWVDGEPTSLGGCNLVSADVMRWMPSKGPPAAFIADRFLENRGRSSLIVLGVDATGVWTAEMHTITDACDDCDVLHLVHTSFRGKRNSHLVAESVELAELEPEQRRARVKQALFRLAAGPWNVPALSQQYRLSLPKHDAEGRLERYTGWFADVRVDRNPGLRFGVRSVSQMCWCSPSWRGYVLKLVPAP